MSKVSPRGVVREGPNGVQIIKESPGGHSKITCPSCHQIAAPQQDGNGKTVLVCPRGHKFRSGRM